VAADHDEAEDCGVGCGQMGELAEAAAETAGWVLG